MFKITLHPFANKSVLRAMCLVNENIDVGFLPGEEYGVVYSRLPGLVVGGELMPPYEIPRRSIGGVPMSDELVEAIKAESVLPPVFFMTWSRGSFYLIVQPDITF